MATSKKRRRRRRRKVLKAILAIFLVIIALSSAAVAYLYFEGYIVDGTIDTNAILPTGTFSKDTVKILDQTLDINSDTVDLQNFSSDEFDVTVNRLSLMPNLSKINLMKDDGTSSVSLHDYSYLKDKFPNVEFNYVISDFPGIKFKDSDTAIDLSSASFDSLNSLAEYFPLFPNITELNFISESGQTNISPSDYLVFKEKYPDYQYTYYIADLFGQKLDETTEYLNLSSITGADIPTVLDALALCPNIKQINLNNGDGTSNLSLDEAAQLISSIPGVIADYPINNFFGYSFNSMDSEVYIQNTYMGDENAELLSKVLAVMTGCQRFVLDECGFSNELMYQLRDTYRDRTKLVWRVHCGPYFDRLTDIQSIWTSATGCINDNNSYNLRYFEDLKYVDLGHHQQMTDISWLYYTPKVEVIIFAECRIKDMTPVASLKNLWYLEIYDTAISDVQFLAECTTLEHINIGGTFVTDISPLYGLTNLKRGRFTNLGGIPDEQKAKIRELIPKAVFVFDAGFSYMGNWRKNEGVMDEWDPIYLYIKKCFGYDEGNSYGILYFDEEKPNTDDFYERCWQAYHNAGYF